MIKKAFFRFYEELNDYLPEDIRKTWFDFKIKKETTVGDAFDLLGVPKDEVDLILVNQLSAGWDYQLQDKDLISVFPVFELLDISGFTQVREKPLREPRFICDVHLGKLCKYLRMIGFDTSYSNDYTSDGLLEFSVQEQRILLTKDRALSRNLRIRHSYWIRSSEPLEQIRDLVLKFDLYSLVNPLTRCLVCNCPLAPVEKELVADSLPEKTVGYFDEFFICSGCNKVYWKGSHYDNMLEFIKQNMN